MGNGKWCQWNTKWYELQFIRERTIYRTEIEKGIPSQTNDNTKYSIWINALRERKVFVSSDGCRLLLNRGVGYGSDYHENVKEMCKDRHGRKVDTDRGCWLLSI
jgi:hypothetical protein